MTGKLPKHGLSWNDNGTQREQRAILRQDLARLGVQGESQGVSGAPARAKAMHMSAPLAQDVGRSLGGRELWHLRSETDTE